MCVDTICSCGNRHLRMRVAVPSRDEGGERRGAGEVASPGHVRPLDRFCIVKTFLTRLRVMPTVSVRLAPGGLTRVSKPVGTPSRTHNLLGSRPQLAIPMRELNSSCTCVQPLASFSFPPVSLPRSPPMPPDDRPLQPRNNRHIAEIITDATR